MKIVFMGSPEFAIPSLEKLLNTKHSIELVVTAPDKERGRGKKVLPTPVKEFAIAKGLNVLSPASLKDENFIHQLKEINADLFIVVAFRILPKEIYTLPSKGAFNLHASLLPKYRGAAPIQWALINGEKETGVTTFFIEEKVDTGNIILQEKIEINDDDDYGSLHNKLMIIGADAVIKTLELIEKGNYQLIKQDESLSTPAPKITKEICKIDWSKSAIEIHNLVRGLSPSPCAFFERNGKIFKVFKTKVVDNLNLEQGKIYQTKNEIFIGTSKGTIQILELQMEGRKRMRADEFLRGYNLN
ncbi:methionyl-tRNA formyltransferase [Rosettibacter firmus]|uniref:methionyl-tRNA formyltransferase n=1 Tax=Rosettibacter firmus TaxID=3111522 RepID=UPI00336BBC1C